MSALRIILITLMVECVVFILHWILSDRKFDQPTPLDDELSKVDVDTDWAELAEINRPNLG